MPSTSHCIAPNTTINAATAFAAKDVPPSPITSATNASVPAAVTSRKMRTERGKP